MLGTGDNGSRLDETMELLRSQSVDILNEDVYCRLEDIASVKRGSISFNAAVDIFLLGYHYGSLKGGA